MSFTQSRKKITRLDKRYSTVSVGPIVHKPFTLALSKSGLLKIESVIKDKMWEIAINQSQLIPDNHPPVPLFFHSDSPCFFLPLTLLSGQLLLSGPSAHPHPSLGLEACDTVILGSECMCVCARVSKCTKGKSSARRIA